MISLASQARYSRWALACLFVVCGALPTVALRRLSAKSSLIKSITILQESGARPRFSPDGKFLIFDRPGAGGFYNVFITDLQGNIVRDVTAGRSGINHRNNGNARFDPSGRYIAFVSEEDRHFGERIRGLGDPGVGLYSNFWATNLEGSHFWKLTNIPIKQRFMDKIPSMAVVNPVFSPDGKAFLWTERYAEGGHNKWGKWRIMAARFATGLNGPALERQYVLTSPTVGNYITAMGFLGPSQVLVAGNLGGQSEYGMDQYSYNFRTGEQVNFTNSPEYWDEDSCVAPNGQIVWMSNMRSEYKFDFSKSDWQEQPVTREYYMMGHDGKNVTQLTHFNELGAPEYLGDRVLVAACDFSPDGRYLAGTIGVDHGNGKRRKNVVLKVVLIEFNTPLSGPRRILQ